MASLFFIFKIILLNWICKFANHRYYWFVIGTSVYCESQADVECTYLRALGQINVSRSQCAMSFLRSPARDVHTYLLLISSNTSSPLPTILL